MKNMKLSLVVATALISCCATANSYGGVTIGVVSSESYGINGKGKPTVASAAANPAAIQTRALPADSSTLAAGFTLQNLFNNIPNSPLSTGGLNRYTFTVASCIDSFVSSVLFSENEKIAGIGYASNVSAGIGLFVLGVEGRRLTFAGYSPFSNGFTFDIYTASTPPAIPATATPEPSTLLVWGGLVALCGASRSLRRLF